MFVYPDVSKMQCILYRPDLYNLKTAIPHINSETSPPNYQCCFQMFANGCTGSFCQCKNQKYLQIWLFPKFPIMLEKHIIYRPFKYQKGKKKVKGWICSFYLKSMHFLEARYYSWKISVKMLCQSLALHISLQRLHI